MWIWNKKKADCMKVPVKKLFEMKKASGEKKADLATLKFRLGLVRQSFGFCSARKPDSCSCRTGTVAAQAICCCWWNGKGCPGDRLRWCVCVSMHKKREESKKPKESAFAQYFFGIFNSKTIKTPITTSLPRL